MIISILTNHVKEQIPRINNNFISSLCISDLYIPFDRTDKAGRKKILGSHKNEVCTLIYNVESTPTYSHLMSYFEK